MGLWPCITIVYEDSDDGWVVASVREVRGVHSQGRTREEARANVLDALRGVIDLRAEPGAGAPGVLTFGELLARAREIRERSSSRTTAAQDIRADRDR